MLRTLSAIACVLLCFVPWALAHAGEEMPWAAGGVGGAYIVAEPGELEVEVFKRDLDVRDRGVELRAMLLGPDREILDKAVFPRGEGSSGPVQRKVLRADVDYPGVYALSIADLDDRHGL